jgi:hypothetical protein
MYFITYEEDVIKTRIKQFTKDTVFFPSVTALRLQDYKTDVVPTGGFNPFIHTPKNGFDLDLGI